jgi:esterase/lipase superfamily enzyme
MKSLGDLQAMSQPQLMEAEPSAITPSQPKRSVRMMAAPSASLEPQARMAIVPEATVAPPATAAAAPPSPALGVSPAPAPSPAAGAAALSSPPASGSTDAAPAPGVAPNLTIPVPAAPPATAAASPTASAPISTPTPDGYQLVNVFYGTDRKAIDPAASAGMGDVGWFLLAATSAAVTLLLATLMLWYAKSRPIVWATATGLVVTLGLGVMTIKARLETPANPQGLERVYGSERGELEMGICQVSIPAGHQVGEVERPSVFRLELKEDPRQHVVMLNVKPEPEDEFFSALKARVDGSPDKEAFVFVHGYNVTFEAAAQRTAQMAYDLKYPGAPIFYSWPSQGKLLDYAVDETNVAWTVPNLKKFLLNIAHRSGASSVHLIAHSMGNRALTSALQSVAYEMKDAPPLFREVILTAPDIDADVFRRDLAPAIVKTANRVTLYASSNDEALKLSKTVHGYPRAGDSGGQLVVVPGIDTVDVSSVDTSLLGHSYYGSNGTVLADLLDLLEGSKPPQQRRWLRPMQLGTLLYWVFETTRNQVNNAISPAEGALR